MSNKDTVEGLDGGMSEVGEGLCAEMQWDDDCVEMDCVVSRQLNGRVGRYTLG